jgi:hypothetical protein
LEWVALAIDTVTTGPSESRCSRNQAALSQLRNPPAVREESAFLPRVILRSDAGLFHLSQRARFVVRLGLSFAGGSADRFAGADIIRGAMDKFAYQILQLVRVCKRYQR